MNVFEVHASTLLVEGTIEVSVELSLLGADSTSIVGVEPLISRTKTGLPANPGMQVGSREAVEDGHELVEDVEPEAVLEVLL